mgnify:CR=1 FL=1
MKIPVALQMYSLRDIWSENPLKAMRIAENCGYTGIELYGDIYSPEFCRALLNETNLVCAGWHTPIESLENENFEKTVKANMVVGNKFLCVPWFNADSVDGWKKFCDRLNTVAEKLAPYGMFTGFHNHAHEFQPIEGTLPWQIIIDNTDPRVIIQLDTGNCMSGNGCPVEWIAKSAGRNRTVHCKPFTKQDGFHCAVGNDDTNWQKIMDSCTQTGDTEWYIVEYEDTRDVEKIVQDSCLFLKQ